MSKLVNFYVNFKNDPRSEFNYILTKENFLENFLPFQKSRILTLRLDYIGNSEEELHEFSKFEKMIQDFIQKDVPLLY